MKRKLVATIMIMTALTLGACGKTEGGESQGSQNSGKVEQSQDSSEAENKEDDKQSDENGEVEVSMEALETMSVTPALDFEYSGYEGGVIIMKYLGDDSMVFLPEEDVQGKKVVAVAGNAFGGSSTVKAVRLSDTVEVISNTFLYNTNLEYVICGNSLKEIGSNAFAGCTSLKEIKLNDGLEIVGQFAFNGCESLHDISIPDTVTQMDSYAFMGAGENITIHAKTGTIAEEVAKSMGHLFEAIE